MIWNLLQPLIGPVINKLVDRIPDPNKRAEAKEELESELMKAVTMASAQQNKVNAIEAGHKSVFVAGWRPFIGWICGLGIAWAYLIQPTVKWYVAIYHPEITSLPEIQTEGLYTLVFGMLGMGGLRTFEKMKGVSRETK